MAKKINKHPGHSINVKKERTLVVDSCTIYIVGVIHGLEREGERVRAAFRDFRPDCIALGIPAEDIDTIKKFADEGMEFDMLPEQERFFEHLSRYGRTSVPPPDLLASYNISVEEGIPIETLDMNDEEYAEVFTKKVSLISFIRNSRRNKKLVKMEFDAPTAEDFVDEWERRYNSMRQFKAIERAREKNMASSLVSLAGKYGRVLAVIPYQRFDGVVNSIEKA